MKRHRFFNLTLCFFAIIPAIWLIASHILGPAGAGRQAFEPQISGGGESLLSARQPNTSELKPTPHVRQSVHFEPISGDDLGLVERAFRKNRLQPTSYWQENGKSGSGTRQRPIQNDRLGGPQKGSPALPRLDSISQEDREALAQLPPVCTSDLVKMLEGGSGQPDQYANPPLGQSATGYRGFDPARPNSPSHRLTSAQEEIFPAEDRHPSQPIPRPSHAQQLAPHGHGATKVDWKPDFPGQDPHADVFSRTDYPSAVQCAQCHQQIFEEWASSSHAYAALSPMFSCFEETINRLAQGTIGYFCLRCHAPVATQQGLRRDQPIYDGPRVFREGVTCIVCHRVSENYTKTNGERIVEPGDIYAPVIGASDGNGVAIAAKYPDHFKTKIDPHTRGPGQSMHRRAIKFEQLSTSDFCMSCHQVAVQPGIKLEVVWDQYRGSPAHRQGVTCQDCHMGRVPGVDEGYSIGPAAVVSGKVVNPERKHSNHTFYGPGYSIAHPGIFPHNADADRWKVNEWLLFDWRAGWGTEAFEDQVEAGRIAPYFPPVWSEPDDRYDAREIVDANLKKLAYKKELRRQVMENGSKIDGPFFSGKPSLGQELKFNYCVTNLNPGHNMPSGSLGAQPQLWLNVVLIGPSGNRLWESGYLDSRGDLADLQSKDVQQRRIPLDKQLFNLQTKFLTTNVKGTDREMYLPINVDFDQLPFIRPAAQPVTVINHPPFIRMESHSLPPLGSRRAKYQIPAHLLSEPGVYRLSVRLRSRAEPIYFMEFCGATEEMIRMMNEWIVDAHGYTTTFEIYP